MTTIQSPANQKSAGTAYLFWFFLGAFGAHKFYLGRRGMGIAYLLTLGFVGIGVLIDLFTLPAQVKKANTPPVTHMVTSLVPAETQPTAVVSNNSVVETNEIGETGTAGQAYWEHSAAEMEVAGGGADARSAKSAATAVKARRFVDRIQDAMESFE